jgi:hypothetical protein
MADPLETIQLVAGLYKAAADRLNAEGKADESLRQRQFAEGLEAGGAELGRLRLWAKPLPASYGDLTDLPASLLAQLSGAKTDALEDKIYAIVKSSQIPIELDRILIELFRRHGDVSERKIINSKCYRMYQKGLIAQVAGKRGLYFVRSSVSPPVEEVPIPGVDAPISDEEQTPPQADSPEGAKE